MIVVVVQVAAGSGGSIAEGHARFKVRCAGCHGADANGGERAPGIGQVDRDRLRTDRAVRDLIRNGIPDRGMPAFQIPDAELDSLVAFVRSRVAPASEMHLPGDAQRGSQFFFGQGDCAGCHMMRGRGGLKGPDLTGAGERLTLAEMETSLRDPNRRRILGYEVADVRLPSGAEVRGFVKNESGFDMQLQGFDGRLYLLHGADIASVRKEPDSLMPPLHATEGQTEDLLAFLSRGREATLLAEPPAKELPGAISWERIEHPRAGDWPTYHGQLGGNRHSLLSQITPKNINSLAPRWIFNGPGGRSLEVTPVVVDGAMYVTAVNTVYALDAATGRLIWTYSRPRTKGLVGDASSGINRGVAVLGNRVFIVTDNAHLLALHRLTGALLWDVEMADSLDQYGATSAPLVVRDLVISGVSGGDEGIRGFVSAYKAATGERVWRFWTVPAPGDPAAKTWRGKAMEHGCASTWLTGTYDSETDLLFWTTGNPCPDFNGDERRGDNLYADSVIALRPATGAMQWYFQFTPHDLHDWDAAETPMVVDAEYHGKPRRLLLQGNRNGFFYVLDRMSGKFLAASPILHHLTWAKGIGADGRPILAEGWEPTVEGSEVCPSMDGASNWMSTAFNPGTGLFYLMALEKCNVFSKSPEWWKRGESFYGGSAREAQDQIPRKYLRAMDLQTGAIAWEYAQTGPGSSWGGILSTATGLLFFGDDNGGFTALDASNGKPLWHFPMNEHWHSSPMTYLVNGTQYVATAAGSNIVAFALTSR